MVSSTSLFDSQTSLDHQVKAEEKIPMNNQSTEESSTTSLDVVVVPRQNRKNSKWNRPLSFVRSGDIPMFVQCEQ